MQQAGTSGLCASCWRVLVLRCHCRSPDRSDRLLSQPVPPTATVPGGADAAALHCAGGRRRRAGGGLGGGLAGAGGAAPHEREWAGQQLTRALHCSVLLGWPGGALKLRRVGAAMLPPIPCRAGAAGPAAERLLPGQWPAPSAGTSCRGSRPPQVAVHPAHRRRGHARALLVCLIDRHRCGMAQPAVEVAPCQRNRRPRVHGASMAHFLALPQGQR